MYRAKNVILQYNFQLIGDYVLLADRTNGRAYGTMCPLSSVCRL